MVPGAGGARFVVCYLDFVIPFFRISTKIKKAELSEPSEPNLDYQQLPAEPEVIRN
jgi:hypothetical protein